MGYTTQQKQGRGFIAWLLLCGMLFGALSPVGAAAPPASDITRLVAATPTRVCRMTVAPKPCCCPAGHDAKTATPATNHAVVLVSVKQGACSCSVRPAPVAPRGNPEPIALVNTATPLGVVPATLPIASALPQFARINALRPACSLGPPLRSPPRSADTGRAPPLFLS